jgi:cation diffusion facilitator CzcD-associated flavoprotein CzcO
MAKKTGAKKRVLVVGAGSAGMSCADALANHPDKFETTLIGTPLCTSLTKHALTRRCPGLLWWSGVLYSHRQGATRSTMDEPGCSRRKLHLPVGRP